MHPAADYVDADSRIDWPWMGRKGGPRWGGGGGGRVSEGVSE